MGRAAPLPDAIASSNVRWHGAMCDMSAGLSRAVHSQGLLEFCTCWPSNRSA